MAKDSFQEKTEQATPKRKEEARKKGQVAKSREISSVAVLLSGLLTLFWGSAFFYNQTGGILRHYLSTAGAATISQDNITGMAALAMKQFIWAVLPLFAAVSVVSIAVNYLQVGPVLSLEAIKPTFSKISPLSGTKRILSAQSAIELAKSIFKIIIVGWMAFATVRDEFPALLPLIDQTPSQILQYLGKISFTIFWNTCLVMALLAVLDFFFQKWEFAKNQRMTKQEVKEEHKQTEGDPHVKSRIKSIQREMARKRMMADVPDADVIITNPTRLAIALKYDMGRMDAPVVLAKGSGRIAEKIKETGKEHQIPIVENKPLSRSLFKLVEIGHAIPENLYQAVAEVLAYVYRLKDKTGSAAG